MNQEFGRRLAKARMARGWSQTELGKHTQTAPTQISRYEAGRARPRSYVLGKLAQVLDVRPEWLASGEEPMKDPSVASAPRAPRSTISVSFTDEELKKLQMAADLRGISLNEFVQSALQEGLAAADEVVKRGVEPTLEAIQEEMARQRALLEDLAEQVRQVKGADTSTP